MHNDLKTDLWLFEISKFRINRGLSETRFPQGKFCQCSGHTVALVKFISWDCQPTSVPTSQRYREQVLSCRRQRCGGGLKKLIREPKRSCGSRKDPVETGSHDWMVCKRLPSCVFLQQRLATSMEKEVCPCLKWK